MSKLSPTKDDGYVQLSEGGANKFAVLQEVVLWSGGVAKKSPSDQCSHLCGKTRCLEVDHICSEDIRINNGRKGCLVWVGCPHCHLAILVCEHEPVCVKYHLGYVSQEDFLANGIHTL